jgi:hypothetical protein
MGRRLLPYRKSLNDNHQQLGSKSVEKKPMKKQIPKPLFRRAIRLLRAINVLHQRGFEELTCTFFAGNELNSWMLAICHIDNLLVDGVDRTATIIDERAEVYLHEHINEGNEYFGWNDLKQAKVVNLADTIEERCASLLKKCRHPNRENVGWFTQVLGCSELSGELPYVNTNIHCDAPPWVYILGTPHFVSLPPACKVFSVKNHKYYFKRVDIYQAADWHRSHVEIIDNIDSCSVSILPKFSPSWSDIKEIGAYWEGAVYFVSKHLQINSTKEFLLFLEGQREQHPMADWFYRIYDNQIQLDHFIAFVVRKHIDNRSDEQTQLKIRWTHWLKTFEDRTHPKYTPSDSYLLPNSKNPYYGGSNPLHLGLVFTNQSSNWLEF